MKKLVSIVLALTMIMAFSVTAFAATDAAAVKAAIDQYATKAGATASDIAAAKGMVDKMNAKAISELNVNDVVAVAKSYQAEVKNGTVDVAKLSTDINAKLPAGVKVNLSGAAISGTKLTVNVGIEIAKEASATEEAVSTTITVTNNGTPDTTTPPATNPVKATGFEVDATALVFLGLAMVACLGTAVVGTRKLSLTK